MPYQSRFWELGSETCPFPKRILILILVSPNIIPAYNFVEAAPLNSDGSAKETSLASVSSVSTIFDISIGTTISTAQAKPRVEPTSAIQVFSNESSSTKTVSTIIGTGTPSIKLESTKELLGSPKLNSTNSTGDSPTRTDKRYGEFLGPRWFYESKIAVECPSVDTILTLDMSGIDRSLFPGSETLILPLDYNTLFPSLIHARNAILIGVNDCKDCDCLDDGEMIPNWFKGTDGTCKTDRDTSICQLVYGCYCSALLTQPQPTFTGVTAEDYQNAMDQIPWSVRVDPRNYGYWWKNAPTNAQGRRVWLKAPDNYIPGFTYSRGGHKELVPGTKEPYYLEGPESDYDDIPLNRGTAWGLGAGKGLVWKRDNVTPANLGGDGEVVATKTQPEFEEDH
ncbi:hypothetical protein TWF506_001829 [Arthrobotrys conoides]|uniref:Uncharacterized protein n=1 Tax=Arthrobotrys conoides TaxID=74498 RepID=A0AAN8PAE4_9PEZI